MCICICMYAKYYMLVYISWKSFTFFFHDFFSKAVSVNFYVFLFILLLSFLMYCNKMGLRVESFFCLGPVFVWIHLKLALHLECERVFFFFDWTTIWYDHSEKSSFWFISTYYNVSRLLDLIITSLFFNWSEREKESCNYKWSDTWLITMIT